MERSRTPLLKWFTAIYLISQTERGISSVELSRTIQVTYKTAWLMLQKIRHAISIDDDNTLLSGIVRANIAEYGRPHNPTIFNHPQQHALLVASSTNESNPSDSEHVKIKLVHPAHFRMRRIVPAGISQFKARYVETSASDVQIITGRYSPNRFLTLLDIVRSCSGWINETFHGLGRKHLQVYLDEFCYRLNSLSAGVPIFGTMVQLCSSSKAFTYRMIVRKLCL